MMGAFQQNINVRYERTADIVETTCCWVRMSHGTSYRSPYYLLFFFETRS